MIHSTKLIRITTVPISLQVLLRRQLKFMTGYFDVLAVSSPGVALDEVAIQEGVRTMPVNMTRSITPVKDLEALYQLYRLFKKEKPVIIHTHTPKAGMLGMIAARMAGVPIRLHTVAGLPLMVNKGIKKKILQFTEWLTYQCASKVYPNSKNLADYIYKSKLCTADKLKVLGNGSSNGIDMEYFQPNTSLVAAANDLRKKFSLRISDFVFVFVGRLVKDKGIEELVAAFMALKETHSNVRLLLVGAYEEDLDPIAPATVELIRNEPGIIPVGFQQDVRPYLMISNALAFPSYREGFPNVPMQAGCFHLPSIVTDINGCNEIIEDGKNGIIIPVRDATALRKAMSLLVTDPVLYDYLKKNARKMILSRYDQHHFWGLLLKEYQDQLTLFAARKNRQQMQGQKINKKRSTSR